MRAFLLTGLALLSALAMAGEPPTRLKVEIGGQTVLIDAGQAVDVDIDGKPTRLRIAELPWRQFAEAGLRFEYPKHFPWEYEAPGTWSLDGNNAVIIVIRADKGDAPAPDDVLDGMQEGLELKKKPVRDTVVLATKQGRITGSAMTSRLASSRLRTEVYVLEGKSSSFVLMLQDSLDDEGKPTAEFIDMRKRLVGSLEF
jgi:hypothetical protein